MKRVLVIDDELVMAGNRDSFVREYGVPGLEFDFCASLDEATRLQFWDYALVLLDIRFEGRGDDHGIELLKAIRERAPRLPVVMLSSRTTPEILIRCWDAGAQAYVVKWTANRRFRKDLAEKIARHARYIPPQPIVGESQAVLALRAAIGTLAGYDISVLITGETGSGKELVARALHDQGKRRSKPFVAVNSGAIPATLIESELFGHVKGAFTGASDRRGKVEEADGGTLFLDEIGDLPPDMQVKLLRLLDQGEYMRVGENVPRRADLRVVAATNRSLDAMVKERKFREDLLFRLNGFKIEVPSLRDRPDDIPLLAEHFLELFKSAHPDKAHIKAFQPDCMKALQAYHWPGNIREMKNVIERAAILSAGARIARENLPEQLLRNRPSDEHPAPVPMPGTAGLPEDVSMWSRERLLSELRLCAAAKGRVQAYKGNQWKAEFMRLMYPECKAANAKGFDDLIRRLTKGPWGDPGWDGDQEIKDLLCELKGNDGPCRRL